MSPKKKCIVVLGVHRSGTSALAGVLNLLGISMGSNLMTPGEDNPKGYFEIVDIMKVNDAILNLFDSSWQEVAFLPDEWWKNRKPLEEFRHEIARIIRTEFSESDMFGFKDPRLCKLLPLWADVLRELQIQTNCIIPLRNPFQVAQSLRKRNGFSLEKGLLLWMTDMLEAEFQSRELPRVFTTFDDLLKSPQETLQKIVIALNLEFPKPYALAGEEIDQFLQAGLKHHSSEKGEVSGWLREMIHKCYTLLLSLTRSDESTKDIVSSLRQIRTQYLDLNRSFYFDEVRSSLRRLYLLQSDLDNMAGHLSRIEQALLDNNIAINERDRHISKLEAIVENIENKDEHISTLTSSLNTIHSSHGWKVLTSYYRLRDRLLTTKGKTRETLKHLRNFFSGTGKEQPSSSTTAKNQETAKPAVTPEYSEKNGHFLNVISRGNVFCPPDMQGKTVDIIIPIFNALDFTKRCLETVISNSDIDFNLYLINDKSTEPAIATYLELLKRNVSEHKPEKLRKLVVLHNKENIGFIKTVNKALSLTEHDVILLNTDTEVPRGWTSRMLSPFLLDDSLASASPFSNSAEICSFPHLCKDNALPEGMTVDELDDLFARFGSLIPIEVPTTVGFCMLLSKKVLGEIGTFDEAFGMGYGEENDWCMRAHKAGYRNVIIPNLFVYHKHGASFDSTGDSSRENRRSENLQRLDTMYPEYLPWVHSFISADPLKGIRNLIRSAVASRKAKGKNKTLFISKRLGGGSDHFMKFMLSEQGEKEISYMLEGGTGVLSLRDLNVNKPLVYSINSKYLNPVSFKNMLDIFDINSIFVNQLVGMEVYKIMDAIQHSKRPYTFFIHDFFCACPSYNLLKIDLQYCINETDPAKCERCLRSGLVTSSLVNVDPWIINIRSWREMFERFLSTATHLIAPSESTREIILKYYPALEIDVKEHELNYVAHSFDPETVDSPELNVAFLGAIGNHKGEDIIYNLLEVIRKEDLPINIKLIGYTPQHPNEYHSSDGRLEVTGPYECAQVSDLLAQMRVSVVCIPSLWPETFSYTANEALLSGYPIITFGFGAPAEKVRNYDCGWIAEEVSDRGILNVLRSLLSSRDEILKKEANIKRYTHVKRRVKTS